MKNKPFDFLLIIVLLIIASFQVRAETLSNELFVTINQRLSYMEDVALYKAKNNRAIEDVEREKIVIDKAKLSAQEKGLDPTSVEAFFKAQISVAKAIQFRYRADLLSQPSSQEPKDLKTEVRPHLLRLGDQIVQQMMMNVKTNGSFNDTQFSEFDAAIKVGYVTLLDKQLLFKALQKVKYLPE